MKQRPLNRVAVICSIISAFTAIVLYNDALATDHTPQISQTTTKLCASHFHFQIFVRFIHMIGHDDFFFIRVPCMLLGEWMDSGYTGVCVCVCVRVCARVYERERVCVCVYVCVRERVRECACI